MQIKYSASVVDKMKNEPPMISFVETTCTASSKMKDSTMILLEKKVATLSLFYKSFKWKTSGQNAGNS